MSTEDLKWLSGLLMPQIALAAGLINTSLNDKLRYPLRIAIALHSISALIIGGLAYLITKNYWASVTIFAETVVLLAIIFYVLKQRDVKGLRLGEHFIEFERVVDVQTSYILDLVARNSYSEIDKAIRQALGYILDVLGEYLEPGDSRRHRDNHDHALVILFAKKNGGFEVLAQYGITPIQIGTIESKFRYKPKVVSVAGYAVNRGMFVCLPDITKANRSDDPAKYWIKSEENEQREGFLLCYPILSGVGKPPLRPLGVICLSSHVKEVYDTDAAKQILDRIAPKIENFLSIYQTFALNSGKPEIGVPDPEKDKP